MLNNEKQQNKDKRQVASYIKTAVTLKKIKNHMQKSSFEARGNNRLSWGRSDI